MPKGIYLRSKEHNIKIAFSRMGNKNPMWKGNNAGLDAVHIWVTKRLPKPEFCMDCKKVSPLDLANISQEYKRDIIDWEWLCRRCHMKKDGRLREFLTHCRGLQNNYE